MRNVRVMSMADMVVPSLAGPGTLLAAAALGSAATEAFLHEETVYLMDPDGRIEPFERDVAAAHGAETEPRAAEPQPT